MTEGEVLTVAETEKGVEVVIKKEVEVGKGVGVEKGEEAGIGVDMINTGDLHLEEKVVPDPQKGEEKEVQAKVHFHLQGISKYKTYYVHIHIS